MRNRSWNSARRRLLAGAMRARPTPLLLAALTPLACWPQARRRRTRPRPRHPRRRSRSPPRGSTRCDASSETGVLTIGVRETSVPFSFLDAQKQPQGYSVDLCLRVADAIKSELQLPQHRGQVRAGVVVQPHPGAGRRQDRPRMRLDDQHARPAEGCRVRVHDVRRGHQDAREEVVERELDRGPARQDRRRHQGHDEREDAEGAERRARARR